MLKKIAMSAAAASALFALPAAADAQPRGRAHGYWNNSAHARGYHSDRDYRRGGYEDYRRDVYYGREGYGRDYERYEDYDRGYDRHSYRRCRGTTGTIVGGAAGALIGREIAGRGSGTLGTVIGAAAGAVAGRSVDRSACRNR